MRCLAPGSAPTARLGAGRRGVAAGRRSARRGAGGRRNAVARNGRGRGQHDAMLVAHRGRGRRVDRVSLLAVLLLLSARA